VQQIYTHNLSKQIDETLPSSRYIVLSNVRGMDHMGVSRAFYSQSLPMGKASEESPYKTVVGFFSNQKFEHISMVVS